MKRTACPVWRDIFLSPTPDQMSLVTGKQEDSLHRRTICKNGTDLDLIPAVALIYRVTLVWIFSVLWRPMCHRPSPQLALREIVYPLRSEARWEVLVSLGQCPWGEKWRPRHFLSLSHPEELCSPVYSPPWWVVSSRAQRQLTGSTDHVQEPPNLRAKMNF